MSENTRFLKFIPSEEAFWLMQHKPNAFNLLAHIANTARRKNGHPDGLLIGQCHLESWKIYGLTEQQYRTAKDILVMRKHITIILTNRSRQKSTTGSTTNSTLVQLCSNTIWDINPEQSNDLINDRATTEQRPSNDKQEGIRKKEERKEEEKIARRAPRPHSSDSLFYNRDSGNYEGITDQDMTDWKLIYPHVDLNVEIIKSIQWLKSNTSKSHKSNWRKYLTGWLERTNESTENKKAYRSNASGTVQDRRTKDINGTPVESPHAGRF